MISAHDWPLDNRVDHVRAWLLTHLEKPFEKREANNIAQILLEHHSGKTRVQLLFNEVSFSEMELVQLKNSLQKLIVGQPVQHVIGVSHFFGFDFKVSKDCLIPRPETEELVSWVLESIPKESSILEIGTGSGCIPIVLKKKMPGARVSTLDVSPEAIAIAKANAEKHHAELEFIEASIFDFKSDSIWDVVVSNPPYIPVSDKSEMASHVLDHEPGLALFVPNSDPLKFYKAILKFCKTNLAPKGKLFVEIHEDYGKECEVLFRGFFDEVIVKKDLQGKDRMIQASLI